MNILKIKTEKDFDIFANIQYQRTLNLSLAWKNIEKTKEYREKAFKLFLIMQKRVLNLVNMKIKITSKYKDK